MAAADGCHRRSVVGDTDGGVGRHERVVRPRGNVARSTSGIRRAAIASRISIVCAVSAAHSHLGATDEGDRSHRGASLETLARGFRSLAAQSDSRCTDFVWSRCSCDGTCTAETNISCVKPGSGLYSLRNPHQRELLRRVADDARAFRREGTAPGFAAWRFLQR